MNQSQSTTAATADNGNARINALLTVAGKARLVGEMYTELAPWIQVGMLILGAPGLPHPIEVSGDQQFSEIDALGCGGWDVHGDLHHVALDLDVGHGRPDVTYASTEEAIRAARAVREFVGAAAEIRRSKGGNGIHVRVRLTPGTVTGNGRAIAPRIAKWLAGTLAIRCDTAVSGRQALWFWSAAVGPRGFELVEPCVGTWTPPPAALADPASKRETRVHEAPSKTAGGRHELVKRARRYAAKMPAAVSGNGGHDAAFHVACTVVHGFDLNEEEALAALQDWNKACKPPWSEAELKHKIQDALKAEGERGKLLKVGEGGKAAGPPCPADLAEEFLDRSGLRTPDGVRLLYYRDTWYRWTGTHYWEVPEVDLEAWVVRFLQNKQETRDSAGPHLARAVLTNLTALTLVPASLELPGLLTNPPQPAPHLIAFTNGVLDFHALLGGQPVRLTPHAPALFSLSCLPFAYDSGATCPTFDQFLNQMFPDPDVRALLQEWTGYNIVYDVSQQRFLILYGEGANGKTVYTTCLRELLGGRNVTGLGLEAFNSGRTFPLAATLGKLANISGEIGEWDKTAEGLLKQYVSGERMTVERKHRDPFEFTPSARLTFCTNTLPRFVDRSDGLWRRLLLVPCTVQILDEKLQDKRLVSPEFWRTSGELPGVLNWAIEGLRRLRQRGHFQEPAACKAAKTEFRVESNPAAVFLAENVRANPTGSIVSSDLYGRYKGWAEAAGHHPLPAPHFGREVGRAFPGATLSTHARLHAMGSTRSRTWTGITFQ